MGRFSELSVQELSTYANISIEESTMINDYLKENYIVKKKKKTFFLRLVNKIKELYKKDNVSYYLENEKKGRYAFIDVAKAIAMIFIFIGHWSSVKLVPFAYSFHLFLFFMASGFFALHLQKDSFLNVVKKLFIRLVIPLFFWSIIALTIRGLNGQVTFKDLSNLFLKTGEVNPNYWFIPCLFAVMIYYWLIAKVIKKPWFIVIICFLLNICFGETGLNPLRISFFDNIPFGAWFNITGFITYGFWYSLGAAVLPLILRYVELLNSEKKIERYFSQLLSLFAIGCSVILLLHKSNFALFYSNKLLYSNFVIARGLVIILAILYISFRMSDSKILTKIGQNTLIYVGMEFIIHTFLAVTFMESFNLGIYSFVNPTSIIMYNLITVFLIYKLIDPINNYFPILNGRLRKVTE